jgi:hypothetical protein
MLRFDQMPESFTGQAIYYAAKNPYLNPALPLPHPDYRWIINEKSRLLLRIGFAFGSAFGAAPLGILYHSSSALIYQAFACKGSPSDRERRIALAFEHYKATISDCVGTIGGFTSFFGPDTYRGGEIFFSNSDVYVPNQDETVALHPYSRGGFFPDRSMGIKAYRLFGCQNYQYNNLKWHSLRFFLRNGPLAALNHKEILLEARWWRSISIPAFGPERMSLIPKNRSYVHLQKDMKTMVSDKTPWIATALRVLGLFVFLTIHYHAVVFRRPSFIIPVEYLAGLFIFVYLLTMAKRITDKSKNEALSLAKRCVVEGEVRKGLHWYLKAAENGFTPAQRVCGLGLLTTLGFHQSIATMDEEEVTRVDEGLKWLHEAASAGDEDAREDLFELIGKLPWNQYNPDYVFKATQNERIRALFRDLNFLAVAKERFASIFNLSPEQLEQFRSILLESDGRFLALEHALNESEGGSENYVIPPLLQIIHDYI